MTSWSVLCGPFRPPQAAVVRAVGELLRGAVGAAGRTPQPGPAGAGRRHAGRRRRAPALRGAAAAQLPPARPAVSGLGTPRHPPPPAPRGHLPGGQTHGEVPQKSPSGVTSHYPSGIVPLSQGEGLKSRNTGVGTFTVVGWHRGDPRAGSEGLSRGSPAGCGTPASPAPAARTSPACWAPARAWRSWICPSARGCAMPACGCCARGSRTAPAGCRPCGKVLGAVGRPVLPPSHPKQVTDQPVEPHVHVCLGPAGWGAAG